MRYKNANVYEEAADMGITISPNAMVALDEIDGTIVSQSLHAAKRLGKVNFAYIIGTCNGKYRDAGRQPDTTSTSSLRAALGIKKDDDKTIAYDSTSDNSAKKTPSTGKVQGYPVFVDAKGRRRVRLPDGGSLPASEEFNPDYRERKLIIPPVDVGTPWVVSNPNQEEEASHIEETVAAWMQDPHYNNNIQLMGRDSVENVVKSLISEAAKKKAGTYGQPDIDEKKKTMQSTLGIEPVQDSNEIGFSSNDYEEVLD